MTIHSKWNLEPWRITGFTDGEGCFYIGIIKKSSCKSGYNCQVSFKISLHENDRAILETIQNYFGVGNIYRHGGKSVQYLVKSAIKDRWNYN